MPETRETIVQMARGEKSTTLATRVLALSTGDKFRLAAELTDLGDVAMAETIGARACQELKLVILFGKP